MRNCRRTPGSSECETVVELSSQEQLQTQHSEITLFFGHPPSYQPTLASAAAGARAMLLALYNDRTTIVLRFRRRLLGQYQETTHQASKPPVASAEYAKRKQFLQLETGVCSDEPFLTLPHPGPTPPEWPRSARIYWDLLGFARICWVLLGFARIC